VKPITISITISISIFDNRKWNG